MGDKGHPSQERGIEALVVDDSAFMRAVISDILERNGISVAAEAADGHEAVEAVETIRPDVITMDLQMPRMDGLKAVEVIMHRRPTPILVLSSHAGDDADITFEALSRGAVDFFTKPGGEVSADLATVEDRLIKTIKSVAASTPPTPSHGEGDDNRPFDAILTDNAPILAIASSTGGPSVVERILSDLPVEAGFRVLIVQHMPESFTERFAARLNRASDYTITEAHDGARIGPGEGVVAPGGFHLLVDHLTDETVTVTLDDGEPVHNVKPAADVTFDSLARFEPACAVGAVVTGMGADGAAGSRSLSDRGATIVAQDEETSVVFGMPQRTIENGCVDTIAPLDGLTQAIVSAVTPDVPPELTAPSKGSTGGDHP